MEDDGEVLTYQSVPAQNALCDSGVSTCLKLAFVELIVRKLEDLWMRSPVLYELDNPDR